MHSVKVLRFISSRPDGISDLNALKVHFGQLPQKQLDHLHRMHLVEYRLDFIAGDLEIVGYEITAEGVDLLAELSLRQKLNHRRKQSVAYQHAENEWRDALDRADKAQDARKARQHGYLVAVFSVAAQTFVEKFPDVIAAIRKLLGI